MQWSGRRPWLVAQWRSCCAPLPALTIRLLGERWARDTAQAELSNVAHRPGPEAGNGPNSPAKLRESRLSICCAFARHGWESEAQAEPVAPCPSWLRLPCPGSSPGGIVNVAPSRWASTPASRPTESSRGGIVNVAHRWKAPRLAGAGSSAKMTGGFERAALPRMAGRPRRHLLRGVFRPRQSPLPACPGAPRRVNLLARPVPLPDSCQKELCHGWN